MDAGTAKSPRDVNEDGLMDSFKKNRDGITMADIHWCKQPSPTDTYDTTPESTPGQRHKMSNEDGLMDSLRRPETSSHGKNSCSVTSRFQRHSCFWSKILHRDGRLDQSHRDIRAEWMAWSNVTRRKENGLMDLSKKTRRKQATLTKIHVLKPTFSN
ncbi:hypothetical protein HOLleu_31764 [Holothuria leucospilota]|uniref:Uncharacterized protein n=1 Tax=Holothuria leucospilota TaxID=206669 RepID=A0A9Q0YUC7_HOLLE|nr:hypothetical protein HOLleu_31764 [Holothuria leucospilota]